MSGNMGGDNDIEEEKDKGLFFYKKPDWKSVRQECL